MTGFWIGIAITMVLVVGGSVLVGRMLSGPRRPRMTREQQMTGLKASGALKHRKSNRE
jgi:hypothetical protein